MVRNVNYALVILFLIFFHFYFYHTNLIQRIDLTLYDLLDTFIHKQSIAKYSDNSTVTTDIIKTPHTTSLADMVNGNTTLEDIQGKIILIGSSVIISNNEKISNHTIDTLLINNIIYDSLHKQPKIYKLINIYLSFFLSFIVLILLFKRQYIYIFILFFFIIIMTLLYLFLFYINGIYISIGYLWFPFIIYFFIITLLFIIINTKDKHRFYQELMESHSSTVESIALVSAIRDDETGEHLKRTKIYIKELAEYLFSQKQYKNILNKKYINLIYQAAPLHDIGKLGIPDSILKKPGKLTSEEFEIMKQHPTLGVKLLKELGENNKIVLNCVEQHHENLDGSGYPKKLTSKDLSIYSQIVKIADIFDALTTKRSYKPPLKTFEAFKIMKSMENEIMTDLLKKFIIFMSEE